MESNNDMVVNHLNRLIQFDIDAYYAYAPAIEGIDNPDIQKNLIAFQQDHEIYIAALSNEVRALGGEPPSRQDIAGYIMQAYTTLRSIMGPEGALKALQTAEKNSHDSYLSVTSLADFPDRLKKSIKDNLDKCKKHLEYLQHTVKVNF